MKMTDEESNGLPLSPGARKFLDGIGESLQSGGAEPGVNLLVFRALETFGPMAEDLVVESLNYPAGREERRAVLEKEGPGESLPLKDLLTEARERAKALGK